ncbi:unnamed protein product (macronuclear) [Paramecium tetraurelia]|uniref:NET domain-containing protein n=1 Tax=Paramecium tetraurelia TaxID=5888 RepID=A0E098_PARTE|nr:uncharacterized protein GSPATT00021883001 [Paramecium tetraurelia]CAK88715.1 unnamed protein product [Paramecium tetraurelia]|eukprot:XP_001456112.1 hypothetical protein (macronuclear) [Paramecium tetraurelia strain d4-2]
MNSNNQIEFYLNSQQVDFIQMKLPQGFSLHLASLIHQREQRISKKVSRFDATFKTHKLEQTSQEDIAPRRAQRIQPQKQKDKKEPDNKPQKILQKQKHHQYNQQQSQQSQQQQQQQQQQSPKIVSKLQKQMSQQEKLNLGENIKQLKYEYLRGVWEIVQESVQANGDDEVEFDIDVLPTKTARKLEAYVTSRLQAKKHKNDDEEKSLDPDSSDQ